MILISKPIINEETKKAVLNVLESGMLAQGPKVKELEEEYAKLVDAKYAVAVNNGTAALHTALYALGIRNGDEVITTPFTFVSSANSIIMQCAKPVFADIQYDTLNIDPEKIEEKITSKTKAILTVDLYGQPCNYEKITEIAKKHSLFVIDDASQAHLAEYKNKKIGSIADITCFSFYATKNMMTGEGGLITTNNEQYAELCKRFRHHGQSEKTRYEYYDLGYNYRMMDLQAAIGLVQLDNIKEWTNKRIENAKKLTEGLKDIKGLITPIISENVKHVFHQYTIRLTNDFKVPRYEFIEKLKSKGVGVGIFYPKPLHLHKHFQKYGYKKGDFPVCEEVSNQVVSIPIHPLVSNQDINKIIKTIKEIGV